MQLRADTPRRLGVAIVGLGGAVATTAVAGIELLRLGQIGTEGLPLAAADPQLTADLAPYDRIVFGGWDLSGDDLRQAAETHRVLEPEQLAAVGATLERIKPWPAVGNARFCRNIDGQHRITAPDHRGVIAIIRDNLQRFKAEAELDGVVVVNLASTERVIDLELPIYRSLPTFERALDDNAAEIGPAMLYAYAAITDGVPYVNFTPSVAADVPALIELAEREGVPVAGKDGKTGQTMMKTVIAPALRSRALHVDGWFSTNILGNRDGLALDDADSLKSKLATKGSVLDQILGYHVEDHLVDIRYYKPRGDNKEAWDNIDVTGFLGQPMQIKVNFLCRDSILAAPLVIELARLQDLALRRGEGGVQEQLGAFFKLPMTATADAQPEHALHVQEQRLYAWLADETAANDHQNLITREIGE
jgi:myo-inositol-1-phosphate synthase